MSKVGRRKKEYPEDKIKGIILSFVEDKGIRSEIPKRTLSEYAKKLFREGNIPWLDEEISDNYWVRTERRGFQLIEEYNAIVPKTLAQNSCNTVQLPKIEEIIKEHCKDLKQLQKNLFPYEKELTLSQDKNNALQDEIKQLKERLNERNICIAALEGKIKLQQETIFKLFNHGAISNPKIRNLMETGEEMDSIVKDAFQNIFNLKADQFLSMDFDKTRNIVNINEQHSKRSLLDDFKKL
ncbi:hypothetical protein COF09_26375 [Bacillus toyonensis]|uniref:hypothetical protein n=1 Tax=Bacillus toyonensis TaxID=155322 RepID=UPI000BFC821A|nr:hypothetical protein [Bacillus toyonensis]PHC37620.1 hypothetical protein COF09_26375 [Bacillus toyonensis]